MNQRRRTVDPLVQLGPRSVKPEFSSAGLNRVCAAAHSRIGHPQVDTGRGSRLGDGRAGLGLPRRDRQIEWRKTFEVYIHGWHLTIQHGPEGIGRSEIQTWPEQHLPDSQLGIHEYAKRATRTNCPWTFRRSSASTTAHPQTLQLQVRRSAVLATSHTANSRWVKRRHSLGIWSHSG